MTLRHLALPAAVIALAVVGCGGNQQDGSATPQKAPAVSAAPQKPPATHSGFRFLTTPEDIASRVPKNNDNSSYASIAKVCVGGGQYWAMGSGFPVQWTIGPPVQHSQPDGYTEKVLSC
jgi:hypothetical protein